MMHLPDMVLAFVRTCGHGERRRPQAVPVHCLTCFYGLYGDICHRNSGIERSLHAQHGSRPEVSCWKRSVCGDFNGSGDWHNLLVHNEAPRCCLCDRRSMGLSRLLHPVPAETRRAGPHLVSNSPRRAHHYHRRSQDGYLAFGSSCPLPARTLEHDSLPQICQAPQALLKI